MLYYIIYYPLLSLIEYISIVPLCTYSIHLPLNSTSFNFLHFIYKIIHKIIDDSKRSSKIFYKIIYKFIYKINYIFIV